MTQQKRKDRTVTIQATNLTTYVDALFKMPIFSQSMPDLVSVGIRQVGQQQVMLRRGLG